MTVAKDLAPKDLGVAVNVLLAIADSFPPGDNDALILRAAVNIATERALSLIEAVADEQS